MICPVITELTGAAGYIEILRISVTHYSHCFALGLLGFEPRL